jgi:hypothetical protein
MATRQSPAATAGCSTDDLQEESEPMTETIGPQRVGDRRGWLQFESLPEDLGRLEDQRLAADHEHLREGLGMFDQFDRAATVTELTLLAYLGYSLPPTLTTHVAWLSNGVRRRSWPTLENGSPT